jgi:hypothetical protein
MRTLDLAASVRCTLTAGVSVSLGLAGAARFFARENRGATSEGSARGELQPLPSEADDRNSTLGLLTAAADHNPRLFARGLHRHCSTPPTVVRPVPLQPSPP